MCEEIKVDEMFGGDTAEKQLGPMLEEITLIADNIDKQKKELSAKKQALIDHMIAQGTGVCNLVGTSLAARLDRSIKINKKGDATIEDVMQWLKANELGDIIKTEPHYEANTLQSTLKKHIELGNELPEKLFNSFEVVTLKYNPGKSKFLANRNQT